MNYRPAVWRFKTPFIFAVYVVALLIIVALCATQSLVVAFLALGAGFLLIKSKYDGWKTESDRSDL